MNIQDSDKALKERIGGAGNQFAIMTIIALLTSIPLMFFKEGMYIHIHMYIYIHICLYILLCYLNFFTYLVSFSLYISKYIMPLTKLNLLVNGVIYIREDVYM
jgi:hypothetical protein